MKQDFQRAVLNRIPLMEIEPAHRWREILFLCDEYQSFATVGESDPTGDEKFFALSRHTDCRHKVHQLLALDLAGCRRFEARSSWH